MSSKARFALLGFLVASLGAVGACGSRTGLFGTEDLSPPGSVPEGGPFADAPADGTVPCTPGRFALDLATAQLMFVLDRSGSMAFALDGRQPDPNGRLPPGVLSRWTTLHDALAQTLTPLDSKLAMGAKFFPEVLPRGVPVMTDQACRTEVGVGILPARGNVASILDVFDTTVPRGGTPTAEAVRLAAQYLRGSRTVARTIILATDGAPNCNAALDARQCTCTSVRGECATAPGGGSNCLDETRTIDAVKDVFVKQQIPVYVIGIGSTERPEFLQVLDKLAVAGGRPRATVPLHYNVQSAGELRAALRSIGESIAKCTYLTPSAPTDPDAIRVEVNGLPVARDPAHLSGWDWVDQAYGTLAFFGAPCEGASSGTPQITGVVSCNDL